jgi:hypothetical protein
MVVAHLRIEQWPTDGRRLFASCSWAFPFTAGMPSADVTSTMEDIAEATC